MARGEQRECSELRGENCQCFGILECIHLLVSCLDASRKLRSHRLEALHTGESLVLCSQLPLVTKGEGLIRRVGSGDWRKPLCS